MSNVIKLERVPLLGDSVYLNDEERRLLHYSLFFPGRKDSRPGLVAAARSDIPVLPDIIARCIKEAHRLEESYDEGIESNITAIVLAGLERYEEVVFPTDRLKHKNLVRGAAFISGVVTEFCSRLAYSQLQELGETDRGAPDIRKWAYNLLVGERQKVTLNKAGSRYAKAIISNTDFADF